MIRVLILRNEQRGVARDKSVTVTVNKAGIWRRRGDTSIKSRLLRQDAAGHVGGTRGPGNILHLFLDLQISRRVRIYFMMKSAVCFKS